jgi:hypothetical protein
MFITRDARGDVQRLYSPTASVECPLRGILVSRREVAANDATTPSK